MIAKRKSRYYNALMDNKNDSFRIVTPRLILKEMTEEDFASLCLMLYDEKVMYAYAHTFSESEAREWLDRQIARYRRYGFGLWGIFLRENGKMIGQCGITMQNIGEKEVPEIGYLLNSDFFGYGYATEGAKYCKRYGFDNLGFDAIYSIIRDNNLPSQTVARRNGMTPCGELVKHYYGIDTPHIIFRITREEYVNQKPKRDENQLSTTDK